MYTLTGRNVNQLWADGMKLLYSEGEKQPSRAGEVLVLPFPVMSVYNNPWERVLFCPRRDANPFFHLFEALWMLSGSQDASFPSIFVKDFGDRFAEVESGSIHDAYGYRWRNSFEFDQLAEIIHRLRKNPYDRQCVLQMWDAGKQNDLLGSWKTRPCNTHAYFRVVPGAEYRASFAENGLITAYTVADSPRLDMTILCRSNDMVWGAYGANAVHFSFLQEYLAGRIGVRVGMLYQFSNNFHGYLSVLDKITDGMEDAADLKGDAHSYPEVAPIGLNWGHWDLDLAAFMQWARDTNAVGVSGAVYYPNNPWFHQVAEPMFMTHHFWRKKNYPGAFSCARMIAAEDWRQAVLAWMARRK